MALVCGYRSALQMCRLHTRLYAPQRPSLAVAASWASASGAGLRPLTTSRSLRSSELEEDHVKHWNAERLLSAGLLGLVPAAFIFPYPALDYSVALALVVHSHWGVEAIIADYCRPKRVGHLLSKLAVFVNYFLSAFMLGGLFYFNYTDVGLVQATKMLWKL